MMAFERGEDGASTGSSGVVDGALQRLLLLAPAPAATGGAAASNSGEVGANVDGERVALDQ